LHFRLPEAVFMSITLTGLLLLLLIAGICGAIGRSLGGGTRGGFLISVVVGFVGALLGVVLARQMHLPELLSVTVDGRPFPILWSIIGGAVLVVLLNLLSGARSSRWRYR
jgi:uncharacterized membrane protein YeaQ/YmgE (transglycosylase-associated protein family)